MLPQLRNIVNLVFYTLNSKPVLNLPQQEDGLGQDGSALPRGGGLGVDKGDGQIMGIGEWGSSLAILATVTVSNAGE